MNSPDSWDEKALNDRFKFSATDALSYLSECKRKARDNKNYERLVDEHTARWLLNDYFIDRTFIRSKAALVAELKNIRDRDYIPSGIYDESQFLDFWTSAVDILILEFDPEAH